MLVVDDKEDAAKLLGCLIETQGHEVRTAGDGEQAIELAAEFRPDLILMDIGMPRMDGYEAAREIRERAWGQDVKLVALSGWGQDEDKRKSQDAGFDEHLVKPPASEDLERLLSAAKQSQRPRMPDAKPE